MRQIILLLLAATLAVPVGGQGERSTQDGSLAILKVSPKDGSRLREILVLKAKLAYAIGEFDPAYRYYATLIFATDENLWREVGVEKRTYLRRASGNVTVVRRIDLRSLESHRAIAFPPRLRFALEREKGAFPRVVLAETPIVEYLWQ